MKIYAVGGQVRDELMGLVPKDRDYVVVGSTHEEMISLGFTQVGAAFPVYLHPESKEEYALARTERSTGPGYHDFEVVFNDHVTIEEDLARRDLTINAIAKDMETGFYIDPFDGISDIVNKILRVTHRRAMIEDPLRVYRLARLFARFGGDFRIALDTLRCIPNGDDFLSNLPNERKVAEIKKCFEDNSLQNKPSLMFDFLSQLGEFNELKDLLGIPQPEKHHAEGDPFVHTMMVLDHANSIGAHPETQWAALCHDLGKVCYHKYGNLHGHEAYGVRITEALSDRFGVPNSWKKLAKVVTEHHGRMHKVLEMKPKKVYELIKNINGEKDPEFAQKFMDVCVSDAAGRIPASLDYPQAFVLTQCLAKLKQNSVEISLQSAEIAQQFSGRPEIIRDKVRNVKVGYVAKALSEAKKMIKETK